MSKANQLCTELIISHLEYILIVFIIRPFTQYLNTCQAPFTHVIRVGVGCSYVNHLVNTHLICSNIAIKPDF